MNPPCTLRHESPIYIDDSENPFWVFRKPQSSFLTVKPLLRRFEVCFTSSSVTPADADLLIREAKVDAKIRIDESGDTRARYIVQLLHVNSG